MWKRIPRTRTVVAFALIIAASLTFGLYWFQPWKLFTNTYVEDALPAVGAAPGATPSAPTGTPGSATTTAPAGPLLVATGDFISHEHKTTGSTQVVRLPDGRHQLVLRDLDTSDGPDLRVWLTDQGVVSGTAGWRVFDDGRWIELAKLKGNRGDQVYDIPARIDPTRFRSVSIWCRRFAVSFGAAELRRA